VTIKTPVTIEINAVVDTGAEVTVMSERRFQEIPVKRRTEFHQAPRSLVCGRGRAENEDKWNDTSQNGSG
jgi:hypothetical protein